MIISKSTVRRASIYITFSNVSICSMWNNESVSKPQCCISCLSKHRLSRTQNTTKLIDLTWPGLTFIRTPDPKHTAPFHFMSRSKSGSRTQLLLKEDHCRNRSSFICVSVAYHIAVCDQRSSSTFEPESDYHSA